MSELSLWVILEALFQEMEYLFTKGEYYERQYSTYEYSESFSHVNVTENIPCTNLPK